MRADHHDHIPAVLLRLGLDKAELLDIASKPLQELVAKLRPGLLASAEHDRHLDFVALPEEPLDVTLLGPVVVRVDLRPDLDLLDDRLRLVLARFPGLEGRLVLELAEVHELADRRPCRRRHLDEVEVRLLCQPERVRDRHDPDLLAGRAYEPNFRYPDTVVDTRFSADVTSSVTSVPEPGRSRLGQFAQLAVKAESPRLPAQLACWATTGTTTVRRHTPAFCRHATPRSLTRLWRANPVRPASLPSEALASTYPPATQFHRRRVSPTLMVTKLLC